MLKEAGLVSKDTKGSPNSSLLYRENQAFPNCFKAVPPSDTIKGPGCPPL
jgi:hypothetical protein